MASGSRLFDLDGTLWDSFPFYATLLGRAGSIAETDVIDALRQGESIVNLIGRVGVARDVVSRALRDGDGTVAAWHGTAEMLEGLTRRGHPLAVVTGLPGSIALPALERLGFAELVAVVIHAGSRVGSKPSAAPLVAALSRLSVGPSRADWYVGDTERDATAASRAGMNFAWASWGYGDQPVGARVLATPPDILDL